MKKLLLSAVVLATGLVANAQLDTISAHMAGTPVLYNSGGSGYVSGNNDYGDLAKYQRFDASHGILATGTMSEVLLWVPVKDDNGGSFDVVVRDFTGGTAGSVLATETISLSAVDTSLAGYSPLGSSLAYNLAVTLTTPVAITASSDIIVGIVLPTTAGDTVALVSNTDGDFADAGTHTWEEWSDNSFVPLNDGTSNSWQLDIAFGVFPVIDYVAGLTESEMNLKAFPNPANDVLNISTSVEVASVSIISMDGKVVATEDVNASTAAINVAHLTTGTYLYEVVAADGSVVRNTFVKK